MSKSTFVNFKMLKQAVTMIQILDHYGLTGGLTQQEDRLSGCCPICRGENPTAFRVSVGKNIWNCFAGCRGGNILDFVSLMESVSIREAALLIQAWFDVNTKDMLKLPSQDTQPRREPRGSAEAESRNEGAESNSENQASEGNPPLSFTLKSLDRNHEYLEKRGITPRTIEEFEVGYCSKGIMRGRVAIPIHNVHGELVAYAGRLVSDATPEQSKYKLPRGFVKEREWFNLHRARRFIQTEPAVIVEGFFDCMKVWQAGIHGVIALMGRTLSPFQEVVLAQAIGEHNKVHLLFDQDGPGIEARQVVAASLADKHYVRIIELPASGIGPDDCSERELRDLLM